MTGDRLRELAQAATPGPWETGTGQDFHMMEAGPEFPIVVPAVGATLVRMNDRPGVPRERLDADARLIALAPDMAVLLADTIDALDEHTLAARRIRMRHSSAHKEYGWTCGCEHCLIAKELLAWAEPLLARFRQLEESA